MTAKQSAAKRARAKLLRRPIGVEVGRAILCDRNGVPITGEVTGVLVLQHEIDRRSLRERKFSVGTQLRAELHRDRNPGFWRKAHVLGGWLADNVEEFSGLGMHDALKRMQTRSGIGCYVEEFVLEDGTIIHRRVAESLNFSDMDEGRFNELWSGAGGEGGWIGWLRQNVFGGLDEIQLEEVELLIQGQQ